ncbi:S1 RNA-binding domain-containing protein [Trichocoleus desertorum]|uniref:S1 RNA-binding domain-containing protein n=1 Tax=Trichocoleus desertorum TaxID=1481672 RepID=UPI003D65EDB0
MKSPDGKPSVASERDTLEQVVLRIIASVHLIIFTVQSHMTSKSPRSQATPSFSMDDFARALEQHDYGFQSGQVVRGKVFNYEANGAYVDIGGKSLAFVPTEEAALRRVTDLSAVLPLNEEQEFVIIRDQDADGQVTLSRRRLEMNRIWEEVADLQNSSQSVQVRVTGTNKGGVTVDVRGLRGFIPRSHLVERNDLEALKGQTLTASFLEVDPNRNKLILSNRMATRAASMSNLEVGQLIEGKVTSIKPFGVFVDFSGTTGLLHINQVSNRFIESLPSLFEVGQPIQAMIVDLDATQGRVSLSTKVLENHPGEMVEQMATVMAEAEARAEKANKKRERDRA